jgi:hypothetical protein
MHIPITLIVLALVLSTGLGVLALLVRRHQRRLLDQRRAVHQLRGAAHIRDLALSTQIYTGRNDIATVLLPLAIQMLDEAIRLSPHDTAARAARRECQELSVGLRDGATPTGPELISALDSESSLNRAQMELTEATRLLARVEKLEWVPQAELQDMMDALKQTQRSVELRLNLRQAAQVALLHGGGDNNPSGSNGDHSPSPGRASPSR